MGYLASRAFWAGAIERAGRAAVWTVLAALGVPGAAEVVGVTVQPMGWRDALLLAAGVAVASLAGSITAGRVAGPSGSPSLVDDRPVPHA